MSEEEQLKQMRLEILGDVAIKSKDDVFKLKLVDAKVVALDTLFPYNKEIRELPKNIRYENWITRCAIELYKRMGSANIESYEENGLKVKYLSSLVSQDLIDELGPPRAGIPK